MYLQYDKSRYYLAQTRWKMYKKNSHFSWKWHLQELFNLKQIFRWRKCNPALTHKPLSRDSFDSTRLIIVFLPKIYVPFVGLYYFLKVCKSCILWFRGILLRTIHSHWWKDFKHVSLPKKKENSEKNFHFAEKHVVSISTPSSTTSLQKLTNINWSISSCNAHFRPKINLFVTFYST